MSDVPARDGVEAGGAHAPREHVRCGGLPVRARDGQVWHPAEASTELELAPHRQPASERGTDDPRVLGDTWAQHDDRSPLEVFLHVAPGQHLDTEPRELPAAGPP